MYAKTQLFHTITDLRQTKPLTQSEVFAPTDSQQSMQSGNQMTNAQQIIS